MSFLKHYFNLIDTDGEQAVLCPFPHHTDSGFEYEETNPSAHINIDKKVFHCKACGKGFSERDFIKETLGCNITTALTLEKLFTGNEDLHEWNEATEKLLSGLPCYNVPKEVTDKLHIAKSFDGEGYMFPVFMYDKLLDIRTYRPGGNPKVMSRRGATMGLIIPFDVWRNTKSQWTIICAGEKDMLVCRSYGFNAITITGGERTLPKYINVFKDKNVAVCYDNDTAGKEGAIRLCSYLKPYCNKIKNIINFHEVCVVDKEDITDYFVKYNKTAKDLIKCVQDTDEFETPEGYVDDQYPIINLYKASTPAYVNHLVRTNVQVVATSESTFTIPTAAIAEKFKEDKKSTLQVGDSRSWDLTDNNCQDILYLMDFKQKEPEIRKNIITKFMKINPFEKYVKLNKNISTQTVHKAYVTDLFETGDDTVIQMEFPVYSLGVKLESGKKYMVTHKLTPNPHDGQKLVMIVVDAREANDSVTNFSITTNVKNSLRTVQQLPGTIEDKVNAQIEKVKGLLGYDGNNELIRAIDLAYNTPLQFQLGNFKERAYLDMICVGESRVGKSSTAKALQDAYKLGQFTSLAGNSATVAGLIGGSNKTGGAFQTRAGLIPQNHKGLIIFEEFSKCNNNLVTELTDIRSSNEVRIARVSGSINLPAMVRMITLSNVKASGHETKPIAAYPNGITVIQELVGTAEDIARYDLMLVLSDKGSTTVNPFWQPEEPFPNQVYIDKIRWVWSRDASQIKISQAVGNLIIERSNELNKQYDSHIKIFGTEAWKKLARLSIAVASYIVSTDDSYENVIITSEIVEYAVQLMKDTYDNSTFRLKEYVEHERLYTTIDDDGVRVLQNIYISAPGMLLHLEQIASTNKITLSSAAGLSNDQYNAITNKLLSNMFIKFSGQEIIPTERFRKGMAKINRNTQVKRIGEL